MMYEALAGAYDALTWDVPYREMAEYAAEKFLSAEIPVKSVLDLACGTGTASVIFAEMGFSVVAADRSAEMLSMARMKAEGVENPPLFLMQPMEKLDLYARVDAVCCFLDSLNYVEKEDTLKEIFRRVRLFLNPGGIFIFDVHSQSALEALNGETFTDEREGVFCVWRAAKTGRPREFSLLIDVFTREGRLWRRKTEEHFEYSHDPDMLKRLLEESGFSQINLFGALSSSTPAEDEKRITFTAIKRI